MLILAFVSSLKGDENNNIYARRFAQSRKCKRQTMNETKTVQ